MSDKLTLITNLHFVKPHGIDIRLYVFALLLEENPADRTFGPMRRIRGFLSDGSLPVFDQFLSINPHPFKLIDAKSNDIMVLRNGKEKPLFSGAILEIAGGEKFNLFANDNDKTLDVSEFADYGEVWEALPGKVAEYWRAPNMPLPRWVSADLFRKGLVGRL